MYFLVVAGILVFVVVTAIDKFLLFWQRGRLRRAIDGDRPKDECEEKTILNDATQVFD